MNEPLYIIDDPAVRQALLDNGYTCGHPKPSESTGVIRFYFNPDQNPNNPYEGSHWYTTNYPFTWHGTFVLPDGQVIERHGTVLSMGTPEAR